MWTRGERWGPDGAPAEAYERVTDPERFRPLHAVGRALLDELEARYVVRREEFLDRGRPGDPEPATMLVPDPEGAASFGLTFTESPGLQLWRAGERVGVGHLPVCACDACDETVELGTAQLREFAETVARGSFGARLSPEADGWWYRTWSESPTGSRGEGGSPVDDAEAGRILERMPEGDVTWTGWTPRPERGGTGARRVGGPSAAIVRFWLDAEGWGVLDGPDLPGGCWTHYSHLEMPGHRRLVTGQAVELRWEAPGQDGFPCRAVRVDPR